MNKKDREHFARRLDEELANLAKSWGTLGRSLRRESLKESSGDLSAYSIHMADIGTDAMEREKDLMLASSESRTVYLIREAFRRLADGSFGECDECGKPIPRKRLEVIPYAQYCTRCQDRLEKSGS